MEILKHIHVDINEDRALSILKCGKNAADEMAKFAKDEAINLRSIIKPQIAMEKINITYAGDDFVRLENNVAFEGGYIAKKLAACSYVVVSVCSLGEKVDEYVKKRFDDDLLAGMAADCIAVTALENLGKTIWDIIVSRIGTHMGITSRLSPGDNGWELSEQRKIFDCLVPNWKTGTTLTATGMIKPLKSASAVYGVGKGIGITPVNHVCSECQLKSCQYRLPEKHKIIVNSEKGKTELSVIHGGNLLGALKENGLSGNFPCGGNGTCGKCWVRILRGIPDPTIEDKSKLTAGEIADGLRLACRVKVNTDMELYLNGNGDDSDYDIITKALPGKIDIDPPVTKKHIVPDPDAKGSCKSDLKKISDGIGVKDLTAGISMLRNISERIRTFGYDFTAAAYKNILIGVEKGDTESRKYGIAVDIGTTTVVCCLVDLADGRVVGVEAKTNSQGVHGADVISRISFSMDNADGTEKLRSLIVGQIKEMTRSLCAKNRLEPDGIYNMVVTGNTTMIHFFLGLPSKNISIAPFVPVTIAPADFSAESLGIGIGGIVSVMPGIASYVGSDITAGILACSITESEDYSMLLDLGTNGEIALGNCRGVTTCAVAAGPAFEGGNIKYGVGGVKGAISSVNLGRPEICRTIGDKAACGICGSGVLDTVSELLKYGIIEETGHMNKEAGNAALSARLSEVEGIRQFTLAKDTSLGHAITFTQKDVREVQLAKAAVSAGIHVLLKKTGISFQNISKLYIAGGFGNFLNMESALNIGLIPDEFKGKTISAGNTAGMGARLYLLSKASREKADRIAELASYVELSNMPEFQEYYVDSMLFE